MEQNAIESLISKRINEVQIEWKKDPFPHAIIDNFLPEDIFLEVVEWTSKINTFQDLKKSFKTYVELNKNVYGDKDLLKFSRLPIQILGGSIGKKIFENFLNGQKLISMLDAPDYGGYYPFHSMKKSGMLGSHVDHSTSKLGDIHVANSIFYVSPRWENKWGGETILFNRSGLKILKKIDPIPNRLMLFIHSSISFHGVNILNCPDNIQRNTYYMDYYVKKEELKNIKNILKDKGFSKPVYCFHSTTFLPFFPLGIRSFKWKFIFRKDTYSYIRTLLKYLIYRYFLNNKIGFFLISIWRFLRSNKKNN